MKIGDADVFPYESAHIRSAVPEPIRPNYLSASPSVDFPIAKYIPDVAVPQQHSGELQHEPLGGRNHVKIDPDQVRAASPSSLGTQTALHLLPRAVTASRRLTVSRRSSLSRLSSTLLAMLFTAIMSQSWPNARMSRASWNPR